MKGGHEGGCREAELSRLTVIKKMSRSPPAGVIPDDPEVWALLVTRRLGSIDKDTDKVALLINTTFYLQGWFERLFRARLVKAVGPGAGTN